MNNYTLNKNILSFLNTFVFINILFLTFIKPIKTNFDKIQDNYKFTNSFRKILCLAILICIYSLFNIDFQEISESYIIPDGLSNFIFSAYLYLIYFLFYFFFSNKKNRIENFIVLFISFVYLFLFTILGLRQLLVWFIFSIFFLRTLVNRNNFKLFKLKHLLIGIIVILIFSFISMYRNTKSIGIENLSLLTVFSAFFLGVLFETSFTVYNFFAISISTKTISAIYLLNDAFFYLIPSIFYNKKYDYLLVEKIMEENNFHPFGTTTFFGEAFLYTNSFLLLLVFLFLYQILFRLIFINLLKNGNPIKFIYYTLAILFFAFFIIRNPISISIKLFISIITPIFLILYFKKPNYN